MWSSRWKGTADNKEGNSERVVHPARVPRSSSAEVRRVFVHHIVEEEAED